MVNAISMAPPPLLRVRGSVLPLVAWVWCLCCIATGATDSGTRTGDGGGGSRGGGGAGMASSKGEMMQQALAQGQAALRGCVR